MTTVTPQAITAAAEALHAASCTGTSCTTVLGDWHMERARQALEAAAPHLSGGQDAARAERERIRKLAVKLKATIPPEFPGHSRRSFAEVLREGPP